MDQLLLFFFLFLPTTYLRVRENSGTKGKQQPICHKQTEFRQTASNKDPLSRDLSFMTNNNKAKGLTISAVAFFIASSLGKHERLLCN